MILLGVPCGDTIKSRTAFSLLTLKGDFVPAFEMGCDVADNRNKLAARSLDFSHLLFIDSDMVIEPDTLMRMHARNVDILGLAANRRKLPLESVVKPLDTADIHQPLPTDLFKAESCGTGVMLIRTSVFKKMEAPWFEFSYDGNGKRIGEDVGFCLKARKAGYSIWVDPTIPVKHLGEYPY